MSESILSAVVTALVEKLLSGDLMNLARSARIDSHLKKWRYYFLLIQAVLADAGQKQIRDASVECWLNRLRYLVYDIDDVLDAMATEAMRMLFKRNQEFRASTSTGKVMKMIRTSCTIFTPRNNEYGLKMRSKVDDISSELLYLVNQSMNHLGLQVNVVRPNINDRRLASTSLVDEFKIMGREEDREALIGKLLGNDACNENFSVVSIVGMGGVGKTTLAHVLYNDNRVKHYFDLRAWVLVSVEFDVFNISKHIFEAVAGEHKNFANLDLLQRALSERLSKKRFLLVLDDVWNERFHEWDLLQRPFVVAAAGSKVIVTTRKTTVASVMHSVVDYRLGVLSHEKAMSLFAKHVLGEQDFEKHPKLESYAVGIVEKSHGLPLALIDLGRILRTKSNEDEWKDVLNSETWNLLDAYASALRLSYNDLPSHLKLVFAYCSLIPKDYEFDKNELVLLWMAEGFLSKSNLKSMEMVGHEYFEELKSRLFFQPSKDDDSLYTMPEPMNDLAKNVAGEFFFVLDENKMDASNGNQDFLKLRHFSLTGRGHGVNRNFNKLQGAICMKTFLTMLVGKLKYISLYNADLDELLPRLPFLKVLSLAHCQITEIPKSIGCLKLMRYLNFSHTKITSLPDQVSDLYNLQSLLVSSCWQLYSLRLSFAKLKNLRHLDISDTPALKKMPSEIGGLSSLQTLSRAIIEGPNDGFKISELKGLSGLQGRLSIEGLHNVTNAGQAKDANLQQKKGLDELVLQWSEVFDDSWNATTAYNVLEELRPHHMLMKLEIKFYGGTKFPSWVASPSFNRLAELTLRGCRSCTHLPALGHLQSLQVLKFYDLECWEKWSTSGGDNDATATLFPCLRRISLERCPKLAEVSGSFPSLEELKFYDMKGLELWSTGGGDNAGAATSFTRLRLICIEHCPKLLAKVSIPLPSLEELKFYDIKGLEIRSTGGGEIDGAATLFPRLRQICIEHCPKLTELSIPLSSLEEFKLYDMKDLEKWSTGGGDKDGAAASFPHLRRISIERCPKLAKVLVGPMTSLQVLNIHGCFQPVLKSLISASQSIRTLNISHVEGLFKLDEYLKHLEAVEDVWIGHCHELTFLWESESEACKLLARLRKLDVRKCRNLVSVGEKEEVPSGVSMESIGEVSFRDCNKLESYDCPNGVQRLEIIECCSMASLTFSPVSSSLKFLIISNCENLKSFPHQHLQQLTSLELLSINTCPNMDSFPCGLWPPNLKSLSIGGLKKPMAEWGHQNYPDSLVDLTLHGKNSGVDSFGVEKDASSVNTTSSFLLPSSLTYLSIRDFSNVESLAEVLKHLTCLEQLHIWRCLKLKDLPESTSSLSIQHYTVTDSWADLSD